MTKPDLTPEAAREVVERLRGLLPLAIDDAERCGCGGTGTEFCRAAFAMKDSEQDAIAVARYGAECLAAREAWALEAPEGHQGLGTIFESESHARAVWSMTPQRELRRVLILPPEPREEGR